MSLRLQGLLQTLGLQQQLVHGHVMLLPLLLQLPLCPLQGLHFTAQPAHRQRKHSSTSTGEQRGGKQNIFSLMCCDNSLLLQYFTLMLAFVQAALSLIQFS